MFSLSRLSNFNLARVEDGYIHWAYTPSSKESTEPSVCPSIMGRVSWFLIFGSVHLYWTYVICELFIDVRLLERLRTLKLIRSLTDAADTPEPSPTCWSWVSLGWNASVLLIGIQHGWQCDQCADQCCSIQRDERLAKETHCCRRSEYFLFLVLMLMSLLWGTGKMCIIDFVSFYSYQIPFSLSTFAFSYSHSHNFHLDWRATYEYHPPLDLLV